VDETRPEFGGIYASKSASRLNDDVSFDWKFYFRIIKVISIMAKVAAAEWKTLKPNMGRLTF